MFKTEYKTFIFNNYLLNTAYPSVCGYGDEVWYDFSPEFEVRRISDNKVFSFIAGKNVSYKFNSISGCKCEYTAETNYCSFTFSLSFYDGVLSAELCNISESSDYEMISFKMPSLVQCSDIGGSLVNPYGGGRKVNLCSAVPQTVVFPYDTCSALELCGDKNTFAVITDDKDVILQQSVIKKHDESNTGIISAYFVNKIKADKENMQSIPVNMKPVEIHRTNGNRWQFSAEILRNRLIEPCRYRYEKTLVYKIGLDSSGQNNPERPETFSPILTLKDAKDIIMKIYKLSGGMKQVVYLVGWQEGGHDFEYPKPYIYDFNSSCGTLEEFLSLREELKKFNVNLSFHDNFDDAYLSEIYKINRDILSIDEKGDCWKGWLWAGGMSYIISPTAYLESTDIKERIKTIKEKYRIDGTYHLDVLSSEIRRYSFRENELSAAEDNISAKIGMIDLFNKENIDITSEILSMPFIGKIGYSQSTRYNFDSCLFIGEDVIPWTVLAFHGITPYKMGANADKPSLLRSIAAGASCSIEIEKCCTDKEFETNLLRNIYLTSIPMTELSYKKVLSAEYDGDKWRIEYEDDGLVEVDFSKEKYTIKFNGKIISKDFETFLPVDRDIFLYYSLKGGKNKLELPNDWEKASLTVLFDDTQEIVDIENGQLKYLIESDTPYLLRKER